MSDRSSLLTNIIYKNPGLHFSEMIRISGMKNGVLTHYLNKLESLGIINIKRERDKTRFFSPEISLEETKIIKIPTLCLTGDEDLSTPPELVEELAAMIEGAKFKLIEGAGHLPCIEKPEIVAKHLNEFARENGYV